MSSIDYSDECGHPCRVVNGAMAGCTVCWLVSLTSEDVLIDSESTAHGDAREEAAFIYGVQVYAPRRTDTTARHLRKRVKANASVTDALTDVQAIVVERSHRLTHGISYEVALEYGASWHRGSLQLWRDAIALLAEHDGMGDLLGRLVAYGVVDERLGRTLGDHGAPVLIDVDAGMVHWRGNEAPFAETLDGDFVVPRGGP